MPMSINRKSIIARGVIVLFLVILAWPFIASAHEAHQDSSQIVDPEVAEVGERRAVIFYNEACGGCTTYLRDVLEPTLLDEGISDIVWKDYINEPANRAGYNQFADDWKVPFSLRSHIMVFVDDSVVLAGHIPQTEIRYLVSSEYEGPPDDILIYQDVMHGEVEEYQVWAFAGPVQIYPADTPVTEYIAWFNQQGGVFSETSADDGVDWNFKKILPLIIVSGLLDGVNPCAFAVLLFFIAFLFTIKRTKARVFITGLVYISAIFIAYLFIGLGLLQAVVISNAPHLMAKVGSWLVIVLGVINVLNYYFPRFPIKLKIPQFSKKTLERWMHKATLPAAFILGILVGLCTFPCSGGIYVAVITLLAAKATYARGLGYLLIYNLMFVVPLLVILFGASNKYVTDRMTRWERSTSSVMRLWSGIIMVGFGVIILIFFV